MTPQTVADLHAASNDPNDPTVPMGAFPWATFDAIPAAAKFNMDEVHRGRGATGTRCNGDEVPSFGATRFTAPRAAGPSCCVRACPPYTHATHSVAPPWWQEGKDTNKARRKIVASINLQKNGFRRVFEITDGDHMPFHVTNCFTSCANGTVRATSPEAAPRAPRPRLAARRTPRRAAPHRRTARRTPRRTAAPRRSHIHAR